MPKNPGLSSRKTKQTGITGPAWKSFWVIQTWPWKTWRKQHKKKVLVKPGPGKTSTCNGSATTHVFSRSSGPNPKNKNAEIFKSRRSYFQGRTDYEADTQGRTH